MSFDDGMRFPQYDILSQLFKGRVNPNGCPATGTFFVSQDSTKDLTYPREMFEKGNYILSSIKNYFMYKSLYNDLYKSVVSRR